MRKWTKVGATLAMVVGLMLSGAAIAGAVTEPGNEQPNPSPAVQAVLEALGPLVEDGTLAAEQAEAVADQLAPRLAVARWRERGTEVAGHMRRLAGEIAEVLGIRPHELRENLNEGMTLAEMAEANGSTGSELVVRVADHVAAHLSVQTTAGRLDADRAADTVVRVTAALDQLVDVEHPFSTYFEEFRRRWFDEALGVPSP